MRTLLLLWLLVALALCVRLGFAHALNTDSLTRAGAEYETLRRATAAREKETAQQLALRRAELASQSSKLAAADALLALRLAALPSPTQLTRAQRKQIAQHPDNARFQIRWARRYAQSRYKEFIQQSELTPTEVAQFKNLVVERLLAVQDATVAVQNLGADPLRGAGLRTVFRAQSEIEDDIFALLGPKRFHEYKYAGMDRISIDDVVVPYEARLRDHGLPPLQSSQRESLQSAYRAVQHPHVPGKERNQIMGSEYPKGTADQRRGPTADTKIQELAAPLLSAEQLSSLVDYHHDYQTQISLRQSVMKMQPETHPHPHP